MAMRVLPGSCGDQCAMDDRSRAKIEAAYLDGATVDEIATDTGASPYQVETYLRWWCDRGCPGADTATCDNRQSDA